MNDKKYRERKRILAYISPDIKRKILSYAKKRGRSMSKEVDSALRTYYSHVDLLSL